MPDDEFKNLCPCGNFVPNTYVMSICDCGQERTATYCESCGQTYQVGGHIGCGGQEDMLRLLREKSPEDL